MKKIFLFFLSAILFTGMFFSLQTACKTETAAAQTEGNLIILQVYGGGKKLSKLQELGEAPSTPITHSFIELYNPTNEDINLNGYSLHYSRDEKTLIEKEGTNIWYKLDLKGTVKANSSFLIRGARHAEDSDPCVTYIVDKYDMEWYESSTSLLNIDNKGIKILLTSNNTPVNVKNPYNTDGSGTKTEGYVDMFGVAGKDLDENGNLYTIDGCEKMYANDIYGQSKNRSFRRKVKTANNNYYFVDTDNNFTDFEYIDYRFKDSTEDQIYGNIYKIAPHSQEDGQWLNASPKAPVWADSLPESLPDGFTNITYTAPNIKATDSNGTVYVTIRVFDENGLRQTSNARSFTPVKNGKYTIKYIANGISSQLECTYNINIKTLDKPEIRINGEIPMGAYINERITLPEISAFDEIGNTDIEIILLRPDGSAKDLTIDNSFVPKAEGNYSIIITATGKDGQKTTLTKYITVTVNPDQIMSSTTVIIISVVGVVVVAGIITAAVLVKRKTREFKQID